jgi:hexosaminidase
VKRFLFQIVIFTFLAILAGCSGYIPVTSGISQKTAAPSIIPKPMEQKVSNKIYVLPKKNVICFNPKASNVAPWLQKMLKVSNVRSEIIGGNNCGNWNLIADASLKKELGEEGYILEINTTGITIKSATQAGLFYGIQSLRQLFPAEIENDLAVGKFDLTQLYIKDIPKYSWRGSMVDVARSFFGLDYLKRHVDRMALYKLNRLHLHLTDDQGWRIEIKSKPALTGIGSKGAVINGNSGYLSQEEYKELQHYAAARNIIIIPEIDLPGHIYSALVAYPELNCEDFTNLNPQFVMPPELYTGYKVGWSKLCLTKPEVYEFVDDVIKEIAQITDGPWIHIGGDEIDDPLYKTFVVKADSIIRKYGKTTIGWEEVTKAPVSNSLISQRWNGKTKPVVDVKVIQSICTSFYFDHANITGQENTNNWCKKDGVSLEDVYWFSTNDKNIIGLEAPVWTELVIDEAMLDNRFWPRTIAVAEIAWSQSDKNFTEFRNRLKTHQQRLKNMGINYFPSPELNWTKNGDLGKNQNVFKEFLP